jgi:hypothetical protein
MSPNLLSLLSSTGAPAGTGSPGARSVPATDAGPFRDWLQRARDSESASAPPSASAPAPRPATARGPARDAASAPAKTEGGAAKQADAMPDAETDASVPTGSDPPSARDPRTLAARARAASAARNDRTATPSGTKPVDRPGTDPAAAADDPAPAGRPDRGVDDAFTADAAATGPTPMPADAPGVALRPLSGSGPDVTADRRGETRTTGDRTAPASLAAAHPGASESVRGIARAAADEIRSTDGTGVFTVADTGGLAMPATSPAGERASDLPSATASEAVGLRGADPAGPAGGRAGLDPAWTRASISGNPPDGLPAAGPGLPGAAGDVPRGSGEDAESPAGATASPPAAAPDGATRTSDAALPVAGPSSATRPGPPAAAGRNSAAGERTITLPVPAGPSTGDAPARVGDAAFAAAVVSAAADRGGDGAAAFATVLQMVSVVPASAVAPPGPGAAPVDMPGSVTQVTIEAPPDDPAFGPSLAVQVGVLARDGIERAEIRLNPAEMGPVAVQILLDGTAARVEFTAESAATRAALEASLPQLAATLRDAGLTLTGGGVFQQPQGRPQGDGGGGRERGGRDGRPARGTPGEQARLEPLTALRPVAAGRVDLYA